MAEGGIHDIHQARLKAAGRLGIHDDASLPQDQEIEQALGEYRRLFSPAAHADALQRSREAALEALTFFAPFQPRLHGGVLDGTADAQAPVQLHLHSDDADAVQRFFDEHGIPAESRTRRLRLDRERSLDAPVWIFSAEALTFDIAVLPYDGLRQPPLSAIDEKPMRRASAAQLRELLADSEIEGYLGSR